MQAQDILYLTADGAGDMDGSSWENAFPDSDLQTAINSVETPGQVWMAAGTYTCTSAIIMRSGVGIYGGFVGNETGMDERDTTGNTTTVTGESVKYLINNSSETLDSTAVMNGIRLSGGTTAAIYGDGIFSNCIITCDSKYGVYTSSGTFINCIISGNEYAGVSESSGTFINCNILKNGKYGVNEKSPVLINCIVWGNSKKAIYSLDKGFSVTYSAVTGGYDGTGNISLSESNNDETGPFFFDPDNDDYRLTPGSPCINTGLDDSINTGADIRGFDRIIGDAVDIGAYEYDPDENFSVVFVCAEICKGDEYTFEGTIYTEAGMYRYTTTGSDGEDSIRVLYLTVNPTYEITLAETINTGESCLFNGNSYSETGEYTAELQTLNGCDSIVRLSLTVIETEECENMDVSSYITDVSCHGESDGAIILSVSGGVEPYSYKWSTGQTGSSLGYITAGSYTVTVTDSASCTETRILSVEQPDEIVVTRSIIGPGCNSSDGSITVSVEGGAGEYTYSWDTGETGTSITGISSGVYNLTVTDAAGCTTETFFEVNDADAPKLILDAVDSSRCSEDVGAISISIACGTGDYSYFWNDGSTEEDRTGLAVGTYMLTVTDEAGCKANLKATIPLEKFAYPKIALVTIDPESGNNLVVWQKEETEEIDYYTVYREGTKNGYYDSIGTVAYSETSIYEDLDADPSEQSRRYKISATDACGNESTPSDEHKTIHLQQNLGLNEVINLDWDDYEGFDFDTYIIYRKSISAGVEELKEIASSTTRYTDNTPPSDVEAYYIAIELPETVDETQYQKSSSGPYSQSMSNISEAELIDDRINSNISQEKLSGFPVPASGTVSVRLPENRVVVVDKIAIISETGAKDFCSFSREEDIVEVNVEKYQVGTYTLQVMSGGTFYTCKIIIE